VDGKPQFLIEVAPEKGSLASEVEFVLRSEDRTRWWKDHVSNNNFKLNLNCSVILGGQQ
jgi:hypothetical protein